MSSFLGKIRNLLTDQQEPAPHNTEALAKVYGNSLDNPDALINRANKRAMSGDVDGAIEDFNEAIQLDPAKATAYFNRGYLNNTVGRFEQAILDFSEAIQLLPDYDEAYYQRAQGRAQLEDFQGAVDDLGQALRLNPFCIKAYYKRAEFLAELDDHQGALADYSQAILNVPKDANAYYRRGLFLAQLGEQPTAIEDFTQAIEHNPKHADAYFNRGYCYAQLGEERKATQDFSQALLHDPNHKAAQYNRAYALGILKAPAEPEAPVLEAAPVREPEDTPAVKPALEQVKVDPVELISDPVEVSWTASQKAPDESSTVKLEPESTEGYFERAQNRIGNGDLAGAIADYTAIIEQDPQNTQAYYQRGQSRSALGETDAAVADLEQAIHWTRHHSLDVMKDFSGELADTISTLKRRSSKPRPPHSAPPIAAAIEAHTRAIHKNPNNAQAYFERGQSRALLGDLEGAIADYSETIRLDPNRSEAYFKRGRIRAALGDADGATDDLNHAIRQKPVARLPQATTPKPQQQLKTQRISPSQCDHLGNWPGNQFCIHCGVRLQVPPPSAPPPPESEAETLVHQGVALVEAGDPVRGIKALASALPLFLEQKQMDRYQATMKLMQRFSDELQQ